MIKPEEAMLARLKDFKQRRKTFLVIRKKVEMLVKKKQFKTMKQFCDKYGFNDEMFGHYTRGFRTPRHNTLDLYIKALKKEGVIIEK